MKQGDSLSEPFAKSKVFPGMVTKMMAIGERSGALDSLLEKAQHLTEALSLDAEEVH